MIGKKLFICSLVDSPSLRKIIDHLYSDFLPKGTHPFLLLSLKIPPKNLDINVHPTKSQVQFLNEDEVLTFIAECIRNQLCSAVKSRAFPVIQKSQKIQRLDSPVAAIESPYSKVRVDSQTRTLESFKKDFVPGMVQKNDQSNIKLKSVKELIESLKNRCDLELLDWLSDLSFVGMISGTKCLVQFRTKLFMMDLEMFCINLLYQRNLHDFCKCPSAKLEPSIELTASLTILHDNRDMLRQYFSIDIKDNKLLYMPVFFDGRLNCPTDERMLVFLKRLAEKVNWVVEKECLDGITKELSLLYNPFIPNSNGNESLARDVVIPLLKSGFEPQSSLRSGFVELTDVKELYKIFERC